MPGLSVRITHAGAKLRVRIGIAYAAVEDTFLIEGDEVPSTLVERLERPGRGGEGQAALPMYKTHRWLTLQEASDLSEIPPDALRRLANRGAIKGKKQGRRWLVRWDSVLNHLDDPNVQDKEAREGHGSSRSKS